MKYIEGKVPSYLSRDEFTPVENIWKCFLSVESAIAKCRATLQEKHFIASWNRRSLPVFSNATFVYISEMKFKTAQITTQLEQLETTLRGLQKITVDRYNTEQVTEEEEEWIAELSKSVQVDESFNL